ncbi:histidinol dehydrogenase, partial [uncultured Candidatus Thioglobus sp.]
MITKLSSKQSDFKDNLSKLLAWESVSNANVAKTVDDIIANIRSHGDKALVDYTNQFDRMNAHDMSELTIKLSALKEAFDTLGDKEKTALKTAADRVHSYHQKQKQETWTYTEDDGTMLGQKITPLDRVGLYVPGGKAAYPSSVLMNAIPAKVAGVEELIMVVPTPDSITNQLVLAAAYISGVDTVFTVGGAQAVAALAYGTQTIPKVDKIVGPGNIYVATAKRVVFGQVGIDMIAGPSEILIICDGKTNPDWIAMDLFSQAEHDEDAQSILLCPDADFIDQVEASIAKLLPTMERKEIIATALKDRGALILTKDMDEAVALSNQIAPEHLELSVEDPQAMLDGIKHAGAIFMGRHT